MKHLFTASAFVGLFLLLFPLCLCAQIHIEGHVIDAKDRSDIVGATIREKGGNTGGITDAVGRFSFTVSQPNAILVVTYTGYADKEVPLEGRTEVEIVLGENAQILEQVVVVGYGVQKKSDLTGAVGTVKAKEIERIPTASVEQALQGKIAGVYVSPASGEPGRGAVIRIRGTGTLNNAGPLYVVDGMLLDDAAFVNPQDVASVEVLKDASATAIYGNRGANGVIIITTKRGTPDRKAVFALGTYYGTQQIAKKLPLANAAQFAEMYNELQGRAYFRDPQALGTGTDWQDVIFRNAPIANVQLSANGVWKKLNYNVSGNYFNQQGILEKTGFDRKTARFNGEYPLLKFLKVGTNLAYSFEQRQSVGGNVLGGAYRIPPVFSERDSAGNFTDPTFFGQSIGNPAADLFYRSDNHTRVGRWVGTVYGDVTLRKGLVFRSSYGFDRRNEWFRYFDPIFKVSSSQLNNLERTTRDTTQIRNWLWENTLTYNKTWDLLNLTLLAGQTAQEYTYHRRNTINEILQPNGDVKSDWAMTSYLFRANAVWLNRYLLTASIRADGSSRFSKNNRWGYFPSFALGWNIAQEPFMRHQRVFDRLKLRTSWGITGNDKIQNYPSLGIIRDELYASFNDTIQPGATLVNYANANVRWETTRQTDVGLEVAVLQGRLSAEIDWYKRFTYDILGDLPIPEYVGSGSFPFVNAAQVENVGWDFTFQWRETRNKWAYKLGAILSPVRNTVLKLNEGRSEIFDGRTAQNDFATRTIIGLPIGAFYGYQVAGVFQNAEELAKLPKFGTERVGDFRFADLNGDGKLDTKDRTYLGSPIPTLTYGFNASIEVAGIDFSADLFGVKGNKVVNAKAVGRFDTPNWETLWYDNHWTATNPSQDVPRITNGGHNYRMSDFLLADGRFLRLRSLVLGYTLPKNLLQRAKLTKARLYASGTNIWTKQKYSGFTPEFPNGRVFEAGIDFLNYPMSKTYLLGLDIQF